MPECIFSHDQVDYVFECILNSCTIIVARYRYTTGNAPYGRILRKRVAFCALGQLHSFILVQEFSIHQGLFVLKCWKDHREATIMKISLNIEVRMRDGVLIITDTEGKAVTFSKDQAVQKKPPSTRSEKTGYQTLLNSILRDYIQKATQ